MDLFNIEAKKEYVASSSELKELKPDEMISGFYQRLDKIIEESISKSSIKPSCQNGCTYCCYYKVEAKPAEIFKIIDYVKRIFKAEHIQSILDQSQKNIEEAKSLTYKQHMTTNQKCPFLLNNSCSIYKVRPVKCRNFHSTVIENCKKSYEDPKNLSIPSSYIDILYFRANGSANGFEKAITDNRYDSTMYDLNSALIEAFNNSSSLKRFRKGKRAFIQATVVDASGH